MIAPKFYAAEEVRRVLNWPMVNEAMKEAFKAVSNSVQQPNNTNDNDSNKKSYADQPQRSITQCGGTRSRILLTMPAFVGNYRMNTSGSPSQLRNTLACKLVTSFSENAQRNPPLASILATILLFSSETGVLESVVEGTQITAWRTAGASVVATQYLFFERCGDKQINVAIIGCGVQGTSHARGMCATFNVCNVYLWNRTVDAAETLAQTLRKEYPGVTVHVSADPAAALAEADVICVGTYSTTALISFDMIKKDNVHINTVGAGSVHFGEVAQDIYDNAEVFVDSWSNAKSELKDLKANIVAEVGEVINCAKQPKKQGITIFQSMGMAVQDATVADAVVDAIECTKK